MEVIMILIRKSIFLFTLFFISFVFGSSPPTRVPDHLYKAFTLNGTIPIVNIYRDDSYSSGEPIVYILEQIQALEAKARTKQISYYGLTDLHLYEALERYNPHVLEKNVAVIGSVTPWYESILLNYGAHPTTIEYNKIISQDPRLEILTVNEYEANPRLFDAIVSISSLEHDGLGRYGDPINPNGDLIWMKKARNMLKKGGLLFLAIPIGKDCLVWNLHRIYGELRLKELFKGWDIVETFGFSSEDLNREDTNGTHQPVFVLKPSDPVLDFWCSCKGFFKKIGR